MLRTKRISIFFLSLFLFSIVCFAQSTAPKQIEYYGTLTDKSNNLVEGYKTLKFRIYDSFTGGTQLWSETKYNISLKRGSFRVTLGSSTEIPEGMPLNCYLQIEVKNGLEWEVIVPRTEITGSVYSITNNTAGTAGYCPSEMVSAGSFCIDLERSASRTSFTDAIEKCTLRDKRLCRVDEIRNAFREKNTLNMQHLFVSSTYNDFEFAAKKYTTARGIFPNVYAIDYVIKGYNVSYWQIAHVGDTYIPLDYSNVCYTNSLWSPSYCRVFTYYRCCK